MEDAMSDEKMESRPPSSMTDEEFDAWWPFDDDDLDEFERDIEESLQGYDVLPDPNWEENRRRVQEMARRTRVNKHPGRITEAERQKLPPGLLAYWRGEAATPYDDPTGWDEFRKTLIPSDDLWRLVPIDTSADAGQQAQPDAGPSSFDNPA
ncbi:hypothetical protein GBAR_LOCUS23511 [Geodia barretti]|uniref:Uncharacterized protein n=1 Tax=Geodia barretti TaxID=519541 RepID=A0AA35T7P9_GEOBA|nr:hypothetical protein GBAR_LOCUS23511 [Geodia barretti]